MGGPSSAKGARAKSLLQLGLLRSHRRHAPLSWRVAAGWLLVATLLVGPMGFGASVAWAKTCGESCPCDDAHATEDAHGSHDAHQPCHEGGHQHPGESDQPDEGPVDDDCPEDCPDDCPDCGCCLGVVLAIVAPTVPSVPAPSCWLTAPPQPRAPPVGALFNVYRPPRSAV